MRSFTIILVASLITLIGLSGQENTLTITMKNGTALEARGKEQLEQFRWFEALQSESRDAAMVAFRVP